jgi:uncharacterized protein
MTKQQNIFNLLRKKATEDSNIEVLWLYGSRAKGNADDNSDYDLAIAYSQANEIKIDKDYFSDELAFKWSQDLGIEISVIDINQSPIPLAYSVILEGKIILCRNYLRLHSEESRIWSMWEAYKYEYARK